MIRTDIITWRNSKVNWGIRKDRQTVDQFERMTQFVYRSSFFEEFPNEVFQGVPDNPKHSRWVGPTKMAVYRSKNFRSLFCLTYFVGQGNVDISKDMSMLTLQSMRRNIVYSTAMYISENRIYILINKKVNLMVMDSRKK